MQYYIPDLKPKCAHCNYITELFLFHLKSLGPLKVHKIHNHHVHRLEYIKIYNSYDLGPWIRSFIEPKIYGVLIQYKFNVSLKYSNIIISVWTTVQWIISGPIYGIKDKFKPSRHHANVYLCASGRITLLWYFQNCNLCANECSRCIVSGPDCILHLQEKENEADEITSWTVKIN